MPRITFTRTEVSGEFDTAEEVGRVIRALMGDGSVLAAMAAAPAIESGAPALREPPNEYTTAEEVAPAAPARQSRRIPAQPPAPAKPAALPATFDRTDGRAAHELDLSKDDPEPKGVSMSQWIRRALAASKVPLTNLQIWAWLQKNGAAHIEKAQVSGNLYAMRQQRLVERTAGSMGADVTWELVPQRMSA